MRTNSIGEPEIRNEHLADNCHVLRGPHWSEGKDHGGATPAALFPRNCLLPPLAGAASNIATTASNPQHQHTWHTLAIFFRSREGRHRKPISREKNRSAPQGPATQALRTIAWQPIASKLAFHREAELLANLAAFPLPGGASVRRCCQSLQ